MKDLDFTKLVEASGSINAIIRFVDDRVHVQILETLGSVELQAAKIAFNNSQKANDPKAEFRLAVGHLQSAHVSFKAVRSNRGLAFLWNPDVHLHACARDIYSCSLMVIGYIYLKEPKLALESLEKAKEASVNSFLYDGLTWLAHDYTGRLNLVNFFKRQYQIDKGTFLWPPTEEVFNAFYIAMKNIISKL